MKRLTIYQAADVKTSRMISLLFKSKKEEKWEKKLALRLFITLLHLARPNGIHLLMTLANRLLRRSNCRPLMLIKSIKFFHSVEKLLFRNNERMNPYVLTLKHDVRKLIIMYVANIT